MNNGKMDCNCRKCGNHEKVVKGESVDIFVKNVCESEIRTDITVIEFESVRIWGQIKDCRGCPISRALVKLLRRECDGFNGILHTTSDCEGFYEFELCKRTAPGEYKIIVGKAPCCVDNGTDSISPNHKQKPFQCEDCKTCAYFDEKAGVCRYPTHTCE